MGLAEKIKELRTSKKISQKKLADSIGVAQSSINYWEKGQRTPSIEAVQKLADYFNTTLDELYDVKISYKIDHNAAIPSESFHSMVNQVMDAKNEPVSAEDLKKVKVIIKNPENAQHTIAAHFDEDEFTPEELEEIKKYAEFLKSKRKLED